MNAEIKAKFESLKPEWQIFIKEYLIDFNKGRAYSIAYNREIDNTSYSNGHQLLKNTDILEIVVAETNDRVERLDISADWVLDTLKELVIRCMQLKPLRIRVDGMWVDSGEFTFDSAGANSALDKIGKYFAMFNDNLNIKAEVSNKEPDLSNLTKDELIKLKELQAKFK